jgi:hypothetical protein
VQSFVELYIILGLSGCGICLAAFGKLWGLSGNMSHVQRLLRVQVCSPQMRISVKVTWQWAVWWQSSHVMFVTSSPQLAAQAQALESVIGLC